MQAKTESDPGSARAIWDASQGLSLASVEVPVAPARVFEAIASREIARWWVRPGVFETGEWTGDVRVGGRWRAAGIARGQPYALEGEFVEVEPSIRLVQTWHAADKPGAATRLVHMLESTSNGTRIVVRHDGFSDRTALMNTAIGWETSLRRLAEVLASVAG